jgi:cytidylate kinase
MTVITLSRQLGSYGEEIAAQVAGFLGLRLIDAEVIHAAAVQAGVPQLALAELENEGRGGPVNRVLKALRTMPSTAPFGAAPGDEATEGYSDLPSLTHPFAGLFSTTAPPISAALDLHVKMVGRVIRGLAREGNVLIVGRGGQILLKNQPGTLHVQVVAPLACRVRAVMERSKLDKRAAQNRVKASDRARADYVRRYHDADWLDPTLYHLVVNTGRVSIQTSVDLIVATQRALQPAGTDAREEQQDAN